MLHFLTDQLCRRSAMKLLLSVALLVVVSGADITSVEWNRYKEIHMKFYTTAHEDAQRLAQYLKTKQMVEEHNEKFRKGETTYTLGINQFADWFPQELKQLTTLKVDENWTRGEEFELAPNVAVQESINWVDKGAVTKVKNQKNCGSCYAFSAAGALEGLMFIKNQTITDLSVQELVDCSSNYGCNGGLMTTCFSYVAKHNGIATEQSYPYEGKEGTCRFLPVGGSVALLAQKLRKHKMPLKVSMTFTPFEAPNCTLKDGKKIGASCTGWKVVPENEIALQNAVGTEGPVSTGFAVATFFMFYKEGVYDGPCASEPNHAMLIVGYDTDEKSGEDFWLLKNSWGPIWGDKGYAKVKRGSNLCNITTLNSFPTYS